MGRPRKRSVPPKHPGGRRPARGVAASARIELRVTPGEKAEIETRAVSAELSTNEYVRRRALGLDDEDMATPGTPDPATQA